MPMCYFYYFKYVDEALISTNSSLNTTKSSASLINEDIKSIKSKFKDLVNVKDFDSLKQEVNSNHNNILSLASKDLVISVSYKL